MKKSTSYKFTVKRNWHIVDARSQNFGRVATRVSSLLQGKEKAYFSPQLDCGDFVVVVNTKFLKVSHPAKWDKKIYYHYTGYPGGIKDINMRDMMAKDPSMIIRKAIFSMLPKNKLRDQRINRLKLFTEEQEGKELYAAMRKKYLEDKSKLEADKKAEKKTEKPAVKSIEIPTEKKEESKS